MCKWIVRLRSVYCSNTVHPPMGHKKTVLIPEGPHVSQVFAPNQIIMNASAVRKELDERIKKAVTVHITENMYKGVLHDQSGI